MWVSPFRIRRARRSVGRAHSVEGLEPRVLLSLVRVGPEVHPGSLSAGTHEAPAVAVGPEGNFVVAWWIERPNNQGDEVDAQRYDAAGTPLGGPFLVSLGSNGRYPAVAMDKGGNFVVTWDDAGSIYARLYDASGTPRANPFFVSPKLKYLTFQQHSAVAMDPDGDFVVSWREEDFSQGGAYTLYARRYNPAGVPAGENFVVFPGGRYPPSAAMDAAGNSVIAWADGSSVYVKRYDAAGTPREPAFDVSAGSGFATKVLPSVAMDPEGDFAVAWESYNSGTDHDIHARIYNLAGSPRGPVFRVNTNTANMQMAPSITWTADHGLIVTWRSSDTTAAAPGIYARAYDANGLAIGGEVLVNTTNETAFEAPYVLDGLPSYGFTRPAVAADAKGNAVVVWDHWSGTATSPNFNTYGQRVGRDDLMSGLKFLDTDLDGVRGPADRPLAGWSAYLDENFNGVFDNTDATAASADVPRNLGFTNTVDSTLTLIGLADDIQDIDVTLDIDYSGDSALSAFLISPSFRSARLFEGVGGGGADFKNTTFDDQAAVRIDDPFNASPPFTGSYHPQDSLAALNGDNPNGTWVLRIVNNNFFNPGTLNSWSLHVRSSEPTAVTGPSGRYFFQGIAPRRYIVGEVQQIGYIQTAPSSGGGRYTVDHGAGQVERNLDFGNAYAGEISGWVFEDRNVDRSQELDEGLLAGWTIFADFNGNGRRDADEPSAVSDTFSGYRLRGIPLGTPVPLVAIPPAGAPWELSLAPGPVTLLRRFPSASGVLFGAFRRGSIGGVKFNDLNANSARDPGEPGLPGWRIYLDQDNDVVYDDGSPRTIDSTDVPKNATARAPARSAININGVTGDLTHLSVTLDLTAPQDGELSATLFDASGNSAVLFENYPAANGDLRNTTFDDEAEFELAEGAPPYTGRFRPARPLEELTRANPNGVWTLEITSNSGARLDRAMLNAWSLSLSTPAEPSVITDANGAYAFTRLVPGTYNVGEVPQPGWRPTVPQTPTQPLTIVSGQDVTALDFGNTSTAPAVLGFGSATYSVGEAEGVARVTVTRQGRTDEWVSVNYSTRDVTATAPADYVAVSGSLLFSPGEISKDIFVPIVNDPFAEPDEIFVLDLSAPTAAAIDPLRSAATVFIVNDDIVPPPGPRVTAVLMGGPQLSGPAGPGQAAFRNAAGVDAAYGYPIPSGNDQVRALSWIGGINSIAVRFDRDVRTLLDPADLSVRGAASVRPYPIAGFSYDPTTHTALWMLPSPVVNDRLRLVISDDPASGVAGLDGEWVNPDPRAVPPVRGSGYPSGDGVAGGVFSFLINVLSGDATGDGQVNALDLSDVKRRLNRRAGDGVVGTGAYAALGDVNGDGVINALDVSGVKQRLNRRLPSPGPESLFLPRPAASSDSDATQALFGSEPILA